MIAMCDYHEKRDYQESVITGQTDIQRTKLSLCAVMFHRRYNKYQLIGVFPYFTSNENFIPFEGKLLGYV